MLQLYVQRLMGLQKSHFTVSLATCHDILFVMEYLLSYRDLLYHSINTILVAAFFLVVVVFSEGELCTSVREQVHD